MARRRAWFWRFWFRIGAFLIVVNTIVWLFQGGTWGGAVGTIVEGLGNILSNPLLWTQVIFVFFLFIANFGILFGPLLLMNLTQIKAFEPGDAQWGVKLEDVRGQKEAKEEIRRVVSIWQSGEQFERAGGKRERGVLFNGPPGTGKTMLAKAIATGFNSPFVSIPGSGFAATFIGIDAIVVRYLAWKAKRVARKWGGQCIVFIDEIDAVGMRRQALGQGGGFGGATPLPPQNLEQLQFYGPWGACNPSGDLVLETRTWRDRIFAEREEHAIGVNGFQSSIMRFYNFMFPGDGRRHGLARAQPVARRDGRDRQPAVLQALLDEPDEHAARRHLHRPPPDPRTLAAPAGPSAAARAGVLHRRHERPARPARPGVDPAGPDGPPRLVPHADEERPARHPRPLHRQGLARRRARLAAAPRRDRPHHQRLFAGDDRAGHARWR